ncbi:MAG: hypothetical protein DRO11_01790 [Methanobacteriota archaeon]|nr:MAG: hypothetical protein DRO11_01790 [Euryarchaeota archaeon]
MAMVVVNPAIILLVVLCAFMAAFAQIQLKIGADTLESFQSFLTNKHLLLGVALYALSAMLFIFALRHGPVTVLYPIIATSYVWVAFLASHRLGESLTPVKWVGIFLILLGVTLVVR